MSSLGSDEKHYTYTIITTDSNKQLKFLHDRMPVILDNGSEEIRTWLDPNRHTWSKELQSLLKPYDGELEVYPVNKDVGKVGNNSPTFIIPLTSSENKSNIANFFGNAAAKESSKTKETVELLKPTDRRIPRRGDKGNPEPEPHREGNIKKEEIDDRETVDHDGSEDHAPLPFPKEETKQGVKRELDNVPDDEPPTKTLKLSASLSKGSSEKPPRKTRSATSNNTASPSKSTGKVKGTPKITNFFGK
jgi:hypothetical protein